MPSSKLTLYAIGAFVILAAIATLWVFPTLSVGPASGLATFSAYWDFACVSALIPIALFFQAGWNPRADRAINPWTKRFVPTIAAVGVAVLLIVGWLFLGFFVFVPAIDAYFLNMAMGSGEAPTLSLLSQAGLIILLPFLCTAAASPAGVIRTFSSARR
jgi:hypothetical protein